MSVPPGAIRAVLQIEKPDGIGSIRIDDVRVTASPDAQAGAWTPYHVADDTAELAPGAASPAIAPGGALDVSFLLPEPAGRDGLVTVKDGRLSFSQGRPARFLGVSLIPPTAFLRARSGPTRWPIGWPDPASTSSGWATSTMPLGPGHSLFDDTRDDTKAFDPEALARLDHLIAALKARGISVALELQAARRFRCGDGVAVARPAPPAAAGRPPRSTRPSASWPWRRPAPCSITSTPRPGWPSATTRPWPG